MNSNNRRKKTTLFFWSKGLAIFLLLILFTPIFFVQSVSAASHVRAAAANKQFCLPFWPFPPCPTPTPTVEPTPGLTPTPSVQPTASPTDGGGDTQNGQGGTGNTPVILTAPNSIVLKATEIDATDAHLSLFPDPLHPMMTFSATTLYGMQISRKVGNTTITITATGAAITTGVSIQTSVFHDIKTALSSFTDKDDLLKLSVGGTIKNLVMKNVTLYIDTSLDSGTMDATGLKVTVSST